MSNKMDDQMMQEIDKIFADNRRKRLDLIAKALLEAEHNGSPIQETIEDQQYWARDRAEYILTMLGE